MLLQIVLSYVEVGVVTEKGFEINRYCWSVLLSEGVEVSGFVIFCSIFSDIFFKSASYQSDQSVTIRLKQIKSKLIHVFFF